MRVDLVYNCRRTTHKVVDAGTLLLFLLCGIYATLLCYIALKGVACSLDRKKRCHTICFNFDP